MGRQSMLVLSLALAACHVPGSGGLSVAQTKTRWEGLPLQSAEMIGQALTLYPENWALVNETARVSLQPGEQIVSLSPVPSQVEARGATLQLPGTVSDRRYRHDLQTRERLMERYHGRTVSIVTATGSLSATLLMTDTGPVYRIGDRLTPDPGGRVVYPPLPDLALEPTLDWIVQAASAWTGTATASYLVNQLGWQNEYTLVTDARQTRGAWSQWAAINNQSGGRFADARITLIAGDVRRESRPPVPLDVGFRAYSEAAPAESFAARYQYRLPQRVTLERNSEVRHLLARADDVPIARTFHVTSVVPLHREPAPDLPRKAQIRLTIANTAEANLGKPLPRGKVTVYTPTPEGSQAVAGEPMIPDMPKGQAMILNLGEAFDVTAQRRQTRYETSEAGTTLGYAITLRNEQDQPVTVELSEQLPGDWTMRTHSHPFETPSATSIRFRPTIPAGGEVTVSYEVLIRTPRPPRG